MSANMHSGIGLFGWAEQLTYKLRPDSDSDNDVYVGQVVLPDGSGRVQAYVKVSPTQFRSLRIYNEVFAHHMALQCELPSPQTFPCACPVAMLRKGTLPKMFAGGESGFVLGVASLDGSPKKLKQCVPKSEVVWAEIMNWRHSGRLAVFDELFANDDRYYGNLIRRAPNDFMLIDNERILFAEDWSKADLNELEKRKCDANALATAIGQGADEMARRRMIELAQRFLMQTVLRPPAESRMLESVCGVSMGTTDQLTEMFNRRRKILPYLMQCHVQKGDLFRASTFR